MIILLHSSKTMRQVEVATVFRQPLLAERAQVLLGAVASLSAGNLQQCMKISAELAQKTKLQFDDSVQSKGGIAAIDAFLGDIYSGLQVQDFSKEDREYADEHLRILSGLYGVLRPLDGIRPYRLEMGYRLPNLKAKNLYEFWGDAIAKTLPKDGLIVNVSSVEYTKAVLPFVDSSRVVTPIFLTRNKVGDPTFVTVHAKIARGAFAHWMIKNRVETTSELEHFNELGYRFDSEQSAKQAPVFVCDTFGGLGLSVRLLS